MVAKLRSCCRIAGPVGGSAAWPRSEEPAKMATPRAPQNGTVQRVSRKSTEDVIGGSHDSTAYDGWREGPCTPRAPGWVRAATLELAPADVDEIASAIVGTGSGVS